MLINLYKVYWEFSFTALLVKMESYIIELKMCNVRTFFSCGSVKQAKE
jgi:hypothetical protein